MQRQQIHILLFLLFSFCTAVGQNMHLTYFSQSNRMPSSHIRDVIQDSYGLFWIASDAGLLRFDGYDFKNYAHQITSQYCRSFCNTPEGLLLSHDAGISLIKPGLDTSLISIFVEGSIDPNNNAIYYPNRIFLRQNGDLWISQPGGRISRITDRSVKNLVTFPELTANPQMGAYFAELEDGKLLVAFSDGRLCYYDDSSQTLVQIRKLQKINDLKFHNREIWIAGEHILKLEISEDGHDILRTETFYSEPGEVTTLSLDSKGNIYLGVKGKGLYYLDRRRGQSHQIIKVFSNNNPHSVNELPFKNIHKIVMESDDRLWICSAEGLGILQRRFFESLGSIPNANTASICIAENGKIFASFGDIYVIDRTDLGYEGSLLQRFSGGNVSALATARELLWIGTSTGILFRLNQEGKTLGTVDLRSRGEGVFYMNYDSQDRLWICQAPKDRPLTGIGCLTSDGSLKEYGTEKGLLSLILCLRETDRGRIYCGGSGKETYLYRYLSDDDTFINLSLPLDFDPGVTFAVHDLAVDKNGVVWLASTNGLLRYDMESVSRVDLGHIETDSEIRAVSAMDDGSIWVSSDTKGIVRYSDSSSVEISEESGLPSEVMTYRCLVKEPGGRLWAGSSEGLVYSLDENPKPRTSNQPLLTSCLLDGTSIPTKGIKMYRDQQLELKIIAPSYHGFKTFYQYSFNAGKWIDLGTLRSILIHDLKPGKYTVSIRASKEGGYLWSSPIYVDVEVDRRWYTNPFILGIIALLFISVVFVYFIKRKKRYSQSISELNLGLEQEKKEIERRNADLEKAKDNIVFEQRQARAHMFSLEIIRRLISKVSPGMKWDMILEIISIDLLKFPGVVAFEIGSKKGKYIEFEGYSELAKSFTTAREKYQPDTCFSSYALDLSKPMIFNDLKEDIESLSLQKEKRLDHYKSAISVSFYLENKPAVLILYSDKPRYFNKYALKAVDVFATYLEQII